MFSVRSLFDSTFSVADRLFWTDSETKTFVTLFIIPSPSYSNGLVKPCNVVARENEGTNRLLRDAFDNSRCFDDGFESL